MDWHDKGFPGIAVVKNPPTIAGDTGNTKDTGLILGSGKFPGGEGMATHSSILAWRIPWTEEPGGLQSTGSERVRHDWACIHKFGHRQRCLQEPGRKCKWAKHARCETVGSVGWGGLGGWAHHWVAELSFSSHCLSVPLGPGPGAVRTFPFFQRRRKPVCFNVKLLLAFCLL